MLRTRIVGRGVAAGLWLCALVVVMAGGGCTGARFEGEKTARVELFPGSAAAGVAPAGAPRVNARAGEVPAVSAYVDLEQALGSSPADAAVTRPAPTEARVEARTQVLPARGRPVVRITSQRGWISVKPGGGAAVDVVAHVRATTPERYETAQVVAVRETDGSVTVRLDWPGTVNVGETAGLEVTVPAEADVDVRTPQGRLSVTGLRGELFLRTGDGDIEVVNHRGPVRAETGSGRVDVVEVTGPVVVRSGRGDVTVVMTPAPGSGAPGSDAGDGAWQIAGAEAKPQAAGSPGAGGLPGVVDIDTGRGTVRLTLTRDFAQELELGTGSGVVDVRDLPAARIIATGQRYMHVAIGEGAGKSRAVTGRGNVVVRVGE